MYIDHILLASGGGFFIIASGLAIFLFFSRGREREYRRFLHQETERSDVVATMRQTYGVPAHGTAETHLDSETGAMTVIPEHKEGEIAQVHLGDDGTVLDISPLQEKYELIREIHGGGMSRTFLARHRKLGSEWIVKFVDGKYAALADEADVLKSLNHISLPQIVDIFQTQQGTFLVERYIEGYTLEEVLAQKQQVKERLIYRWGIELAQVLNYLHHLDTPIIHCDLKPWNIIVTYDDRLVLIDFGIAKRQGISRRAVGLSQRYAAPEQFQGVLAGCDMALRRFGELPPAQAFWEIDERTDLYGMGVILFELVVGQFPTLGFQDRLRQCASNGLSKVISMCLQVDPSERYQSAKELEHALEGLVQKQTAMVRSLVLRRVALLCCILTLLAGLGATASGAYINQIETQAILTMSPGDAVVTEQQSIQLLIQKEMPNGRRDILEPQQVQWSASDNSVARLEGNRLVGVNAGETTLQGTYRNKEISLHITVKKAADELTDVSLRYVDGVTVEVCVGDGVRELADGAAAACSFVAPAGLSAEDGRLYIADSGSLRVLADGTISTMSLEPSFLTVDRVRSQNSVQYLLTGPWEDGDDSYYGFLRIADGAGEFLFYTEAAWSVIPDFALDANGTLWFIWQNLGTGTTALHTMDVDTQEVSWVADLPASTESIAIDGAGTVYLAVPEEGVILRLDSGEQTWRYFAGVKGERNMIDGGVSNFYRPTSLAVNGAWLYVLDFDTVRRVSLAGEDIGFTETLAGVPVEDTDPRVALGAGSKAIFASSEEASLETDESGMIFLSDPKNSVIYRIQSPAEG